MESLKSSPCFPKRGKKKPNPHEGFGGVCVEWVVMDSNHRSKKQQIYSLPHLATLETTLIIYIVFS